MARTLAQVDARLTTEISARTLADTNLSKQLADLTTRVKVLEAPPPPPSQIIRQFPGTGPGTVAAFQGMLGDMSLDVIEIAAGTYPGWVLNSKNMTRKARPLLVRPAPGADIIWDGLGANSLFQFGSLIGAGTPAMPTGYITFDAAGGSFLIRDYAPGSGGLIYLGWVEYMTLNGFKARDCTGTGNQSHCLYLSSDNAHVSTVIKAGYWDVGPFVGRSLSAFQAYHDPGASGVKLPGWNVKGCHRAAYLYTSSGFDIDGWTIADSNVTFDVPSGYPVSGSIKNCHSVNSGPLALGSGYWMNPAVTDGGGNSSA